MVEDASWFSEWLRAQKSLQWEGFGVIPVEEGPEFFRYNLLGVVAELGEVMQEADWRPWSSSEGEVLDHDSLVEEFVDVLHFLGNAILWAGIEGDELTVAYREKINVNIARQKDGYAALDKRR